jgi:hypothetical protein
MMGSGGFMHPSRLLACAGLLLACACSPAASVPSELRPSPVEAAIGEQPLTTLWQAPPRQLGNPAHAARPSLDFTRLALNDRVLAFDLLHSYPSPDQHVGPDELPQVAVQLDGCPVLVVPFLVPIPFGGEEARIALPRELLPFGEIDITVSAYGSLASLTLRHDGDGFEPITSEQRAGYHEFPAEEGEDSPGYAEIEERPSCPGTLLTPGFERTVSE